MVSASSWIKSKYAGVNMNITCL